MIQANFGPNFELGGSRSEGVYGKDMISVQATACTENQWFPYSAFPDCVLKGFVARAIRLYEQEPGEACVSSRFGLYVRRWARWVQAGLPEGRPPPYELQVHEARRRR